MHYLGICAIVKDEGPYIEEWINYHHAIGVDIFYLYDNGSTDGTLDKIKKFGPLVSLQNIKGPAMQCTAYMVCLSHHRRDARWIAFIDGDEFLVPRKVDNLKEFLVPYEKYPGLGVHWAFFGSNGHLWYKPEPVVERFTKRMPDINHFIKTVADPQRTIKTSAPTNPHSFYHKGKAVREDFGEIEAWDSVKSPPIGNLITLNHYVTKSMHECILRRTKPRADVGLVIEREFPTFFDGAHTPNDIEDTRARDLWRKYVSHTA